MPPQRRATMRVPPFFRRLFKFTSMDFETAVWEMTHLIIAPKKVFRNIYYHVCLAWGIAYAPNTLATLRITAVFVLVHFLGVSLLVATGMYFLVGRVLGRRRRQGLFGPPGDAVGDAGEEVLEFGYCFDFLLLPLIARDYWVSNLFGNTMYLLALSYYFVITFLGYNALPFLSRTEVLLAPIPVLVILWIISLFTFDCATNLAPVLWCGVNLRKPV
ncbi:hypothetical protein LTR57_023719 [Friedmanniomyces endolithicus]|nr:hypothetical protein LTR57_023719 [Friedmanniomyces endolithicus]KAK0969057.1 hypothetical protein LTS01_016403 [Friedmanniomyces endolithicus]